MRCKKSIREKRKKKKRGEEKTVNQNGLGKKKCREASEK